MRIAGHSQVLLKADIDAELQGVIPEIVGGIAHPLELVLLLVERAVTGVHVQRVPEIKAAGALQMKSRHAGSIKTVEVQSRDAGVLGGRSSQAVGVHENAVAEKSEAEIGQPASD